ncbi:MAG: hypothetical protein JKY65_19135 [Planctomycetes bacterium]|nr:hypothetical protein [Planctomycetota bacterium]
MVLEELERRDLLGKAVIVKSLPDSEEEPESDDPWIVVWPKGFEGTFNLL